MKSQPLYVPSGDILKRIFPEEILYFESQGRCCQLKTKSGNFLINKPIGRLFKMLPTEHFIRIHKNYIVSIFNIHKLVADERLPLGKPYLADFCSRVIRLN